VIEPAASGRWAFRHSVFEWRPGVVTVRFASGRGTEGDWGRLLDEQRQWYEGVVAKCGYASVPAYSVHHDFCHLWLPERLWGIPSPTLWAVAHAHKPPPINASEEYLVNTVQWTLATGDRDWNAEYLRQIVGEDWRAVLDALQADLDALAEPA
jgi:hypothetical protein